VLIIGAGGHAKEVLDILTRLRPNEDFIFYDDVNENLCLLFNKFKIIKTIEEAELLFTKDPRFVLGIGGPLNRMKLAEKFKNAGGTITSVISPTAIIGNYDVILGKALNIMHHVFISNSVKIGDGSLINAGAKIHHDTKIGNFCEISPGTIICGGVQIEDLVFIGAGAVLIPKVKIGSNSIIGAGSVVINDIPKNSVAVGVPAKVIRPNTT